MVFSQVNLVIIGITVGLALGLLLAVLGFFAVKWYKNNAHLRRCDSETPVILDVVNTSASTSSSFSISSNVPSAATAIKTSSWWTAPRASKQNHRFASASGIPRYAYKDIQKGTQNFTTNLGQGSFGPVYKAVMATGEVGAVKVLASDSKQGEKEFQTEVLLLARLHHRNLVNLIGYCVDKGQHMLLYEFMSNGSLADLLYGERGVHLSWDERLQISLDISHGIEYLHEGAVPPVIHRDLKTANILLDSSMRAKVADFGLSKEEVFDGRNSGLKGTYGYIDPVYISTNKFTMKSDIYSFGVIIYELITAIHPHQNLMEYVDLASMSSDGVDEILDKKLVGECNIEEVRRLANIANKCLHKIPRKRPSVGEVSQAILRIKQRRIVKDETMSLTSGDFSRMVSRIENQQVQLSRMASVKERGSD